MSTIAGAHALLPTTEMIVSGSDRQLTLVDRGKLIAEYAPSTSKFGSAVAASSRP